MRPLTLCIFFFCCIGKLCAQQFGANPFHIRWKQINTDTARIIFPAGMDSAAGEAANIISAIGKNNVLSIGNKLNKINIVLQNETTLTNGYVGLGPFRSEFYTTPPSNNFELGSMPWIKQLALHEYRHVQQYNNFNNGLSSLMKKLFGQDGYALAINASVPNWFFEGDAVYQETVLSAQGRGRIPYFLKAYPSLWQSGKKYSWMKLRNGSLKDYVPSHYDLGYLLVNYGAGKYGYDFWGKVTNDASAYKGLFYPMQKAVKKYSGISYNDFVSDAFDYYKDLYQLKNPVSKDSINKYNVFPVDTKTLTNYSYPFQISENKLLYQKSSVKKRSAFYIKYQNEESLIRYRDISIDDQFSYRNGKIVYAAYEKDPRWDWLSYSVVKILDINSGKQKTLKKKTRYFSPDISPDGSLVVANNVSIIGKSSLVVSNTSNGSIVREITQADITYFVNPKIIDNNTVIAILRKTDATTCIGRINLTTGTIENLTPPSLAVIDQLDAKENKVYFTAGQNLKDEIFCYDIQNQHLQKLKAEGIDNYFTNVNHGKINWAGFTADGYQLKQTTMGNADWETVSMDDFINKKNGIVTGVVEKDTIQINIPEKQYESKKYSKLSHPINFHSWRPNYSDPEFSFTVYGNNVLNTVQTQVYYLYNENNKTHAVGGTILYGGLFPYLNLGSEYIFNRRAIASKKLKEWNEWDTYAGFSIPLSWANNQTYKSFSFGSNYYYRTDFNTGVNRNLFKELSFSYLAHSINWTQQIQMTTQDIYPRLGYSVGSQFRHTLNEYKSWQAFSNLNIYLPGLIRTHSLVLNGSVQYSGSPDRVFSNRLPFARGYAAQDSAGAYSLRTNYHFPVFYPDWGAANIFYIQRIRANLFYDYSVAFNKDATKRTSLQSTGAEIYFDTKWWNQHSITFGIRGGYLSTATPYPPKKFFIEFLLPTGLVPR